MAPQLNSSFANQCFSSLVAVHGLNFANVAAFGVKTWTAGNRGEERLWLQDFLPHRLPNVRVLLFGYNSNVAFNTSMMGLGDIADDLLHKLWTKRQVWETRIAFCESEY